MAGFQQAANAIVGAPGQIMRATGIYNELVGKNQELIEELIGKNDELEKKNKELEKKDKTINYQKESMAIGDELLTHYRKGSLNMYMRNMEKDKQIENLTKRVYSNVRARASRDIMLDYIYGENQTESPDRKYYKELLKKEREEGGR